MQRSIVVFAAILLLIGAYPLTVPQANADVTVTNGFSVVNTQWGTSTSPVEAGPGTQDVLLTITLLYYYQNTATNVVATLSLPQGFTDINGQTTSSYYVSGNQASGTVITLSFYLNIGSGVTAGTYSFPLSITWGAITWPNPLSTISLVQYTSINVILQGKVQLQFSAQKTALNPGTANQVPLVIRNTGTGDASNITITLTSPTTVSILNTVSQVPVVKAGTSPTVANLSIYAPLTSAGSPVTLTLSATYVNAYGNSVSTTAYLGLYVINPQFISPIVITVQPTILTGGVVNNLTMTITNAGKALVSSISLDMQVFNASSFTLLGSGSYVRDVLNPGKNFTINPQVYEPANPSGSTSLRLTISYYDDRGQVHSEVKTIGLLSRGIVILQLTDYTVLPNLPPAGTVFSVTGTLNNMGTTAASSVMAIPQPPQGFRIFGAAQSFIGDLAVSTPTPFTITFSISNTTRPGQYTIPIKLSYFDNLRTTLSGTVRLNVTIGAPVGGRGGPGTGAGGSQTTRGTGGTGTVGSQILDLPIGPTFSLPFGVPIIAGVVLLVFGSFVIKRKRKAAKK